MASLTDRAVANLARGAMRLLRALGPARASNLGGRVARAIGPLLSVSRLADANLRAALPELDAAARARIIRGVWDNLGRTVAELPHVPHLRQTDSGPGWEVVGAEHVSALAQAGGPAILISGHIANWEVLPLVAARHGVAMSSFYRAASNTAINDMIQAMRADVVGPEVPHFPKGAAGARAALAHLREGGFLGMLIDQKMNDGIPVPFFGRPAMTAPAAAALALRFGCPVLPGHVERLGPARLRVVVEPPMVFTPTGDRQADILAATTRMNQVLERWVRARPQEWLWLHRRWPKPGDMAYRAPNA